MVSLSTVSSATFAVVVVTPEQLTALIREAVETALAEHEPPEAPVLLERNGIARALGIGLSTVGRLQKAGMPVVYIGDSPRYLVDECIAWLKENRGPLAAERTVEEAHKDFP